MPTRIDMTPTWEAAARMLAVIITNGEDDARADAAQEVIRMGRIIEDLKREVELVKAGAECAVEYTLKHGGAK